jgi:CBS domain-containing protein
MRVEQIMARPVQYCGPNDTLAWAAQLMWHHDCGCLPVCAPDGPARVVGIITDRDICMCALFNNAPLADLRVSEAMAKQVKVCTAGDSLADAEAIMRAGQIRRLPVVDTGGALVGMISIADLAQEAARSWAATTKEVTETEIGNTLAAICRPLHHELAA